MKNILFLDDNSNRWKEFNKSAGKTHKVKWVETAKSCIKALETNSYDEVFLDHDLGGKTYVNTQDANCGMEVVRYIVKNREKFIDTKFIVHSWNPPAGNEMCDKLCELNLKCCYVPFSQVVLDIAVKETLTLEELEELIRCSPFGDLRR